jgi:hypothetical protein
VKFDWKSIPIETREPSPATKRAMREVNAGRGLTRIGSTKEEVQAWSRRIYERASKKQKV